MEQDKYHVLYYTVLYGMAVFAIFLLVQSKLRRPGHEE